MSLKEFLGYNQSEKFEAYLRTVRQNKEIEVSPSTQTPLPRFRTRQVQGSAVVSNGQTLVLRGGNLVTENVLKDKVPVLGDIPLLGRLFTKERKRSVTKQLVIFVTPRLIDPSGKPISLATPMK